MTDSTPAHQTSKERQTTIRWSECTSEGAERAHLRETLRWTVWERIECLSDMCDQARELIKERHQKGLPYIDPYTGQLVRPPPPKDEADSAK